MTTLKVTTVGKRKIKLVVNGAESFTFSCVNKFRNSPIFNTMHVVERDSLCVQLSKINNTSSMSDDDVYRYLKKSILTNIVVTPISVTTFVRFLGDGVIVPLSIATDNSDISDVRDLRLCMDSLVLTILQDLKRNVISTDITNDEFDNSVENTVLLIKNSSKDAEHVKSSSKPDTQYKLMSDEVRVIDKIKIGKE